MINAEPTFTLQTVKALIKQFTGQEQVIGIPRPFIQMTGDHICALVLNQIIYLSDSFNGEDGWFYRKHEQWEEDICVSPYKLRRACEKLAQFGVETKLQKVGTAPVMHFRINYQVFIPQFTAFLESEVSSQSGQIMKKLDYQETSLSDAVEKSSKSPNVKKLDYQETQQSESEVSSQSSIKDKKNKEQEELKPEEESGIDITARVENVFADYCATVKQVSRTHKRLSLIKVRLLEGRSETDLHSVWLGSLRDPWPDRKLHNDITHLLETPERIERMIELSTMDLTRSNGNGRNQTHAGAGQGRDRGSHSSRSAHEGRAANAHLQPKRVIGSKV